MVSVKILVLFSLLTVVDGLLLGKKCDRSGNNLQFIMEIDMEGDSYQYATLKNSSGHELRTTCGTEGGQITGTGNSSHPLSLIVTINATEDITLGSPDCGHTVVNTTLTWTVFIVYTKPPIPGAIGRQVEQTLDCNFDNIVHEASVGVAVNTTGINGTLAEQYRTVILHQTRYALEMTVVKEYFTEYGAAEEYKLADNVRLRIRTVNNITGLYGYQCKACNSALCDDLIFPMLDSNGCKYPDFTELLGSSSSSVQPTHLGTFMIGHLTEPANFDFTVHAGMAFTEEFSLFRFIGSKDVYFQCSVGYCESPTDRYCTNHCSQVTNQTTSGRRRREADDSSFSDADDEVRDFTIAVITVEGNDDNFLIDYPRDDEPQIVEDVTAHFSAPAECIIKPEYIGIFITLGILLLITYGLVTAMGIRLIIHKV